MRSSNRLWPISCWRIRSRRRDGVTQASRPRTAVRRRGTSAQDEGAAARRVGPRVRAAGGRAVTDGPART